MSAARLDAAADLLASLAADLHAVRCILRVSLESADPTVVVGALALVEQAGSTADTAAAALGLPRHCRDDEWLRSPRTVEALRALLRGAE